MENKITKEHLVRKACVYVRQSTLSQVHHNLESKRLQYGLTGRAKSLGWQTVEIIDDDLGCSGSGSVQRKGFERLVASVCLGEVGAVLSLEASRLARNNRDWHQLVDICGMVGTLIIDQDGVYDARLLNDRLLLGLKGTMSEFELGLFRQRAQKALEAKAERGELYTTLPIGFLRSADNQCEKDANLRIQNAVQLVFDKFKEMGSVRQTMLWFRNERVELPYVEIHERVSTVRWKPPVYNTILKYLKNPIYAGAYAFGRTMTKSLVIEGRLRKAQGIARPMADWKVLIRNHHTGYLLWSDFERNQLRIQENANMHGLMQSRGAPRTGESLMAGLLRCGRCGRKLYVAYVGAGGRVPRYRCREINSNHPAKKCISFGGGRVDAEFENRVLEVLRPAAIRAAFRTAENYESQKNDKCNALKLALEQARYETDRAFRQYDSVDPGNRLVSVELARRWNEALEKAKALEKELALMETLNTNEIAINEKSALALADDFPSLWADKHCDMRIKKRIIRILVEEVIVNIDDTKAMMEFTIHWAGGQHSLFQMPKNRSGAHRYTTEKKTVDLVRELAQIMPDASIASCMNRLGIKTGRDNNWTQYRVSSLRRQNEIPAFDAALQKKNGLLSMIQAADYLKISPMSVQRLIEKEIIPSKQIVPYAPRLIFKNDLKRLEVVYAVECIQKKAKIPLPENQNQETLNLN
jgi:DNA invertase Pin-like site-specific DNA recombinase